MALLLTLYCSFTCWWWEVQFLSFIWDNSADEALPETLTAHTFTQNYRKQNIWVTPMLFCSCLKKFQTLLQCQSQLQEKWNKVQKWRPQKIDNALSVQLLRSKGTLRIWQNIDIQDPQRLEIFKYLNVKLLQNCTSWHETVVLAAIFAQHYSPSHNGVYIQNVGYCGYLCVASTGTVYTSVSRN